MQHHGDGGAAMGPNNLGKAPRAPVLQSHGSARLKSNNSPCRDSRTTNVCKLKQQRELKEGKI